jgi:SPP1 gp7 family putative phage head morphogenesis protein
MASIKPKEKDKKGLAINNLVVRTLNRNVLDVGQWRTALKAADYGRRQKLYELYEDILIDSVLSNAISKRVNSITNSEINFMRDEQPVPEMDDLIDSPGFETLITEVINSRFWGKSVIELDFSNGLTPYNIPRQHIHPEKGLIVINPGDEQGIPYRGDDFFLEAGDDKDFGLLMKAAPHAIYKRGNTGDWAQFCELFGIPFKIGRYSAQDDSSRTILDEALDKSGSASYAVIPKETEVEVINQVTKGNGEIFNDFRKACNEEILITILGQTMTTIDGSSKSQSETHKEVEEDIFKSDRRFVQRILNTELLPRLEKRGFPVAGGWFTFPDAGESISMVEQVQIDATLINQIGLNIDLDFLYDFYGRPKGKEVKQPPAPANPPAQKDSAKDPKKLSDPGDDESSFWIKLREGIESFFVSAPLEGASVEQLSAHQGIINLADLPVFDIEALARRVADGTDYFDPELFYFTSGALIGALRAGFARKNFSVDITYGFTPDAYKAALETNLFQFSAAKTLAEIQMLNSSFRNAKSFNEFLGKAREISDKFNQTWLRTEYDTAYNIAESSATYYRLMAQKSIFPYWQYLTMNDSLVRTEHARLHGLILSCENEYWNKIYPPNGWNCRCWVSPVMTHELPSGYNETTEQVNVTDYLKSAEWKKSVKHGFGVNRALTGEVFTANQMYVAGFPGNAGAKLNVLTAEKWGFGEVPDLMTASSSLTPPFSGTAAEVWKKESSDGILKLQIYNGRYVEMNKRSFDHHTSRKKENRISLWAAMKETIISPDEIWLNNNMSDAYDNYNLLKFYKDKVIVVNYKVEGGKLLLKTWYEMVTDLPGVDLKNTVWNKRRCGLPIKKSGQ